MNRILCRFTHEASILCEGYKFWVYSYHGSDWFEFHDTIEGFIVSATNLDEGLVHIVTEYGSLYEIRTNPHTTFQIQKLKG